MATFFAIILFGFSLYHYDKEAISLEMLLLICALCLIVLAIDCASSSITSAIKDSYQKQNTTKPNETKPIGNDFEDADDIDEYPHLNM